MSSPVEPPVQGDRSPLFPDLDRCPECGSELESVAVHDLVALSCTGCGALWHVELGVVYPIQAERDPSDPEEG